MRSELRPNCIPARDESAHGYQVDEQDRKDPILLQDTAWRQLASQQVRSKLDALSPARCGLGAQEEDQALDTCHARGSVTLPGTRLSPCWRQRWHPNHLN